MTHVVSGRLSDSIKKATAVCRNDYATPTKHFNSETGFASKFTGYCRQGLKTESMLGQTTLEELSFDFRGERCASACNYVQSPIQRWHKGARGPNLFDSRADLSHSLA
jgi:hypothetical protein